VKYQAELLQLLIPSTMPVTTRNGRPLTKMQEPLPQPSTSLNRSLPWRPSPYLLLIYAAILATGSLYATISPSASPPHHPAPLAPGMSSDLNTPVIPTSTSYFAHKHNLLNVYFVKIGWFWTTLAFVLLQLTTPPARTPHQNVKKSHHVQSAIRYTLVTLSWIFTTQWLFGPALVDRSFTITGGHCEGRPVKLSDSYDMDSDLSTLASGPACKAAGGRWRGGHDISGHVFMLVLSSAFLLFELYLSDRHSSHPSVSPQAAAAVAAGTSEEEKRAVGGWESETMAKVRIWSRYIVWAVTGLDLWMLMMTAIWFHTWLEKLSGLMLAGSCIWCVYFLPDLAPVWRQIVGGL